jgi:hypothetical protein
MFWKVGLFPFSSEEMRNTCSVWSPVERANPSHRSRLKSLYSLVFRILDNGQSSKTESFLSVEFTDLLVHKYVFS